MSNSKRKTLKVKIMLMALLIIFFTTTAVSTLVYLKTSANDKEAVISTTGDKVNIINERLNAITNNTISSANLLYESNILKDNLDANGEAALYSAFEMYKNQYPEILTIIFSRYNKTYLYPRDADAEAKLASLPNPEEKDWYIERAKEENNSNWTEPYIDDFTGTWIITYYQKVYEGGKHIGFIEIDLSLAHIEELVKETYISDKTNVIVADNDGCISITTKNDFTEQTISNEELLNFIANNENGTLEYTDNSEKSFAVVKTLTGNIPWKIIATMPKSELYIQSNAFLKHILLYVIVIAIMSIIASAIMSERIVKNIRKFNENLNQLGEGDLTTYCTINSNDELSEMCDVFNHTIENIRNLIKSTQDTCGNLLEGFSDMSYKSKENTQAINLIVESIQDIAEGASAQASETTRMVNHFGELSGAMKYIDKSIVEANEMVSSTQKINTAGIDVVHHLLEATKLTNESTNKVKESIVAISETSSKIDDVVKTINDMADEVKALDGNNTDNNTVHTLAEDFSKSASEVTKLISLIKEQTNLVVKEMEVASKNTESQTQAVKETGSSFDSLYSDINKLSTHVNNIGVLNTNMTKIKNTMTEIVDKLSTKADLNSQATQSISAMTEEQLATMLEIDEHLTKLTNASEYLKKEISKFKTNQ